MKDNQTSGGVKMQLTLYQKMMKIIVFILLLSFFPLLLKIITAKNNKDVMEQAFKI
jgi:hypothetical protein